MTNLRTGYSLAVHCGRGRDQTNEPNVFSHALGLREAVYCNQLGWETAEGEHRNKHDANAIHLVAFFNDRAIGTVRIVLPIDRLPVWSDHVLTGNSENSYASSLQYPEVGRLVINAEALNLAKRQQGPSEAFQGQHDCCQLMFNGVYQICDQIGFSHVIVHTTEPVIRMVKLLSRHNVAGVDRKIVMLEEPTTDHTGEPRGVYLVPTGLYQCVESTRRDFVTHQLAGVHEMIQCSDVVTRFRETMEKNQKVNAWSKSRKRCRSDLIVVAGAGSSAKMAVTGGHGGTHMQVAMRHDA